MKQCKSFRNGQVFCFTGRWGAVGVGSDCAAGGFAVSYV